MPEAHCKPGFALCFSKFYLYNTSSCNSVLQTVKKNNESEAAS